MRFLCIYPYDNIDSNPTMWALFTTLSSRGHAVDVLTVPGTDTPVGEPLPNIRFSGLALHAVNHLGARSWVTRRVRQALAPLIMGGFAHRYHALLAADPAGLAIAARIDPLRRYPLVYLSFELMFDDELTEEEQALKDVERATSQRARLILIQDDVRAGLLCDENGLARDRCCIVPNAPLPTPCAKTDWLRGKLGIAGDRRIVLFAGGLWPFTGRDLLADLVAHWPQQFVLVVHNKLPPDRRTRRFAERLARTGQFFFTNAPLPRERIVELYAAADYGLAPYRPTPDGWSHGRNIEFIGRSSGKVAYYAMCGLPMLASALPMYEQDFAQYGCGATYRDVQQAGQALQRLDQEYDSRSRAAVEYYRACLDPTLPIGRFCDRLCAARD